MILGIEPPDRFPLVYYRDNCADIHLNLDHIDNIPFADFKAAVFSGTALSKDPSRPLCFALELAQKNGVTKLLDLDFRADQWDDPRSFGVVIRTLLPQFNIVIGIRRKILALTLQISARYPSNISRYPPRNKGNIEKRSRIIASGVDTLIVKRGKEGASIFEQGKAEVKVPGFPVEVLNVLGAGDAFAGGFSYGYLNGWDLYIKAYAWAMPVEQL